MTRHRDRRPLLSAVLAAFLSTLTGLRLSDAVLVGCLTLVIVTVVTVRDAGASVRWPPALPEEVAGSRREVSALTWSLFGRKGRVTEVAVRRLRADATRRLARGGVVIAGGISASTPTSLLVDDDVRERARAELGEHAWKLLTDPGGWMPSLADIAHCVDVVENLEPDRIRSQTRGQLT